MFQKPDCPDWTAPATMMFLVLYAFITMLLESELMLAFSPFVLIIAAILVGGENRQEGRASLEDEYERSLTRRRKKSLQAGERYKISSRVREGGQGENYYVLQETSGKERFRLFCFDEPLPNAPEIMVVDGLGKEGHAYIP